MPLSLSRLAASRICDKIAVNKCSPLNREWLSLIPTTIDSLIGESMQAHVVAILRRLSYMEMTLGIPNQLVVARPFGERWTLTKRHEMSTSIVSMLAMLHVTYATAIFSS